MLFCDCYGVMGAVYERQTVLLSKNGLASSTECTQQILVAVFKYIKTFGLVDITARLLISFLSAWLPCTSIARFWLHIFFCLYIFLNLMSHDESFRATHHIEKCIQIATRSCYPFTPVLLERFKSSHGHCFLILPPRSQRLNYLTHWKSLSPHVPHFLLLIAQYPWSQYLSCLTH